MQPSSPFNFPIATGVQTTTPASSKPIAFDTLTSNQTPFALPQANPLGGMGTFAPAAPAPAPSPTIPAPQAPRPPEIKPATIPTPAATGQVTTPSGAVVDSTTGALVTPPATPAAPTLPTVPTSTAASVAEQSSSTLGQKILDIADRLGLRSSRKAELETKAGVAAVESNIQSLSDQINALNAQNQADIRSLEGQGRGIDQTILSRQGNEVNRQYAIKSLPLTAQLQAAQGALVKANNTVDRALEAEFGGYEAQLKALESAYNLNKDVLTREDKKAAQTFELQLADYNRQLEEAKTNKAETLKIANAAASAQAPAEVLARIQGAKTPMEALQFAAPYLGIEGSVDRALKMSQIEKNLAERAAAGTGLEASNLLAYAQQYASTGAIPTGLPKGTFGSVSQLAKELPKPAGSIVNSVTGVTDSKTPAIEQQDYVRLFNIFKNVERLKKLDEERLSGVVAGTVGKVFGSDAQANYLTTRKAIIDDMQRMQSGAALTKDEQEFYADYLPGRFSESFFLGQDSTNKIANFGDLIENRLRERLNANNLSIVGFSKVSVGGNDYAVGQEITNEAGQVGRVNADGTITILQ